MANFEDFLSEGKKLQIKRKYTENHPAKTVGKTASVRNAVLQAIKDGVVTREEFNKILSELSADSRQWSSRNRKYFNVSEEGIKLSKWGRRILAELDETPKAAEINEKIKVTKDKFPYIEFKDGGKKYEVEFDQGDIIDDHGNEGKDWYYVGVDQNGDEWEIDVYTDYRDEPEDWFHDTIKRVDESVTEKHVAPETYELKDWKKEGSRFRHIPYDEYKSRQAGKPDFKEGKMEDIEVEQWFTNIAAKCDGRLQAKVLKGFDKYGNKYKQSGDNMETYKSWIINAMVRCGFMVEGVIQEHLLEKDDAGTHLDNLESIVGKTRDFFAIGKELDKGGYKKKYFYSDTMAPSYTIEVDGFKFAIINKKYVDKGDREVGDIAIGLLENMNTNMKKEFTLYESFGNFLSSEGVLNEAIKSSILRTVLSNGREGKEGKKNLSQLAKGFYNLSKVALDKIEDEDFIVSNDVSKVFKNYGGSSHVLFFISDNEKENPYYDINNGSWNDYKMVPGGGVVLAAMSGGRQFFRNEWSRWSGGRTWSKNKKGDEGQIGINHKYRGWGASGLNNGKRIAEMSDRVIVINLELIRQKYSTDQLRSARAAAKAGATAFKSDKEFKDANLNRYHKILADKAASLPLDKMVADAIDKLAKQISDGLAKGEKTRYQEIKIGESPKGSEVKAKDASQHMSNILDDYARYVDYIRQAEESEARYGERESYYERESKNYAKRVKERINKIDSYDYAW